MKTKSNTRKKKGGKEMRNNYKGRENTYMDTYSGSGVLQSTQLTKVSSSKLRKMVQGRRNSGDCKSLRGRK
jgi:hypothetical protein